MVFQSTDPAAVSGAHGGEQVRGGRGTDQCGPRTPHQGNKYTDDVL